MRSAFTFFLFIFLMLACTNKNNTNKKELSDVREIFTQIEKLCIKDGGKLWGFNLNGSVLLINPSNYDAFTSDEMEGFFHSENIFIGKLPENMVMANTLTTYKNKPFTLLLMPLPSDSTQRKELILQELFKQHQSKIGLDKISTPSCIHLVEKQNRIWMKIETEALKRALSENSEVEKQEHIRLALAARKMRRISSGEFFERENSLELKEGLPFLTGLLLNGVTLDENKLKMVEKIDQFQKMGSFVKSFAYCTLPAYGLLMSEKNSDWLKSINAQTNLTDFFQSYYNFTYREDFPVMLNLLKKTYNGADFEKDEDELEKIQSSKKEEFKTKFLSSPFVMIQLTKDTYLNFDENGAFPLDGKGFIYSKLTAADKWGNLIVTGNALVNNENTYLYISAPSQTNENSASGADWELKLRNAYTIKPYKNTEKFILTKN